MICDTNSDESVMLYQQEFGEPKHLSSDTLHNFFEISPYCTPFNSNLHAQKKHRDDAIVGAVFSTHMEMACFKDSLFKMVVFILS